MAFISNNKTGRKVKLTQDVNVLSGTYTKGHEFTVIGYSDRGEMELRDSNGLYLSLAPWNFCIEEV